MPAPGLKHRILRFALAAALVPAAAQAQAPPTGRLSARDSALAASRRATTKASAALAQAVRTIPNVTGLFIKAAIDSLASTKLTIVQVAVTTDKFPAGTVFYQSPSAGTPVSRARAETLHVARVRRQPPADVREPTPPTATRPPPVRSTDDVGRPPTNVVVNLSKDPGAVSVTVPGVVVQSRTRVPDLIKRSPQQVSAALEQHRLRPGNEQRDYDDAMPAGLVFKQHPPAGDTVTTWSPVDVWYSIGPHPRVDSLRVPPVLGLDLAHATDSLRRVGFARGHVDTSIVVRASGAVADQSPPPGTRRHRGDAVDLTIAVAPKRVRVPDIVRLSRDSAESRLTSAGLGVGAVTLVATRDLGQGIVRQSPAGDTFADSGSLVDLVENRPPEERTVEVPDLTGLTLAGASQALRRDSLFLGDVRQPGTRSVDRVVRQEPSAGSRAFLYTAVDLTLGSDTTTVLLEVPDLLSLPIDSARRIVMGRGFTRVSIRSERDSVTSASVVTAQDPPAGRLVNPDLLVSIVVAIPALPPVPDVRGLHPDDAEAAVTVRGLRLVIVDRVKSLRLSPAVIVQSPAPPSPLQSDAISVVVAIPFVPPGPAAAVFGLVVVGGAAGYTTRRKRLLEKERARKEKERARKEQEQPQGSIQLDPEVSSRLGVDSVAPDRLIKGSLTLRVEVKEQPPEVRVPDGSLIKSWRPRDG